MNWQAIAHCIRCEAAYWMALIVCPSKEAWEGTYEFFYKRGEDVTTSESLFSVPYIIDFGKEIEHHA